MLKIAICDDEPIYLEKLQHCIQAFFTEKRVVYVVDLYDNSSNLIKRLDKESPDILFLDIDMPGVSGIEIANRLRKYNTDVILIFCTNIDSFVFQTIQYAPFRFIRKSKLETELPEVLDALQKKMAKESVFLTVVQNYMEYSIKVTDVMYFESFRHCIEIHYQDQVLKTNIPLDSLENEYGSLGFIRIHKSYLVNYRFIYDLDFQKKTAVLDNGSRLLMSRRRMDLVKKLYMNFTRSDLEL